RPEVPYVMFTGRPATDGHTVRPTVGNWLEADAIGTTPNVPGGNPSGSGHATCEVFVPKRPKHRLVTGWSRLALTPGSRGPKNGLITPRSVAGLPPARPRKSIESHGRRTEPLWSPPLSQVAKPIVGVLPAAVGSWLPSRDVWFCTPFLPLSDRTSLPRPMSKPPFRLRAGAPVSFTTLTVWAEDTPTPFPAAGARAGVVG